MQTYTERCREGEYLSEYICFVLIKKNYLQLREQGAVCRDARNDCDIPEYCTGDSGDCPKDVYKKNGNKCGEVRNAVGEVTSKLLIK